ncbi:zinc finger protein 16-like [Schistocerca cancellata]|uniref:zinc finger protein 16-like n=1 Tax=Schistocerca cancellata TaxID=274614 RepID=UPI0021181F2A|nr:zinc finger protein 16-like [Schistocerca cancellata]
MYFEGNFVCLSALVVHGSVTQGVQQCGTVLHQGSTHAHLNDRSLRTHPGRWSSAFVDISGRRKRSVLLKDLSFEAAELLHQNSSPKGKGIYPCRGCGKVYRWYQNLVVHQRIECGKEPQFQCPYCPSRTTQKSSLITHIKRRHPDNQYQVTSSDMELF